MDKKFICLVSCKPYDDIGKVIKGIEVLKEEKGPSIHIEPYLSLTDIDQMPEDQKSRLPELKIGRTVQPSAESSPFAKGVEGEILKDTKAKFVFVGEQEMNGGFPNSYEAVEEKIRASIYAGLPVILGVREQDTAEQLRETLQRYFSVFNDEEREAVTLVYQSKRLGLKEIRDSIERCRAILEEIGGAAFAGQVKILYSIPKYTPELLKKLLLDQIDGVCISPGILPKEQILVVEKPPLPFVQEFFDEEELEDGEKKQEIEEESVQPVKPEEKRAVDVSKYLTDKMREEVCLIFCHSYDDVEKAVEGLKELAETSGHSKQMEWLFALPFASTATIEPLPDVRFGAWNLSFANTRHLTHDVHFSILKDKGASFIVLGDRLSREQLNASEEKINGLLRDSLSKGIDPVVGVTYQKDLDQQIESLFRDVDPEAMRRVRIVFFAGLLGQRLELEAADIEERIQLLRKALENLYGGDVSQSIKILIEVSHFADDPFSYLSHRSIDGISLSASAIKSELVTKWKARKPKQAEVESLEEEMIEETPEEIKKEEPKEEPEEEEEEAIEELEEEPEERVETEVALEESEPEVEAEISTVRAAAPVGVSMSDEEMEQWAEEHPEGEPSGKVDIEFEESEEKKEPVEEIEVEEPVEVEEDLPEATVSTTPRKTATTVAEGLELVKLTVNECAERLAEKNFQETYIPSDTDLEPPEAKLKRMKTEYKRMFEDFRSRSSEGWEVLLKEMKEKNRPERKSIVKALHIPLEKIMEFTEVAEEEPEESKPWYGVIGLSKEQIHVLYEVAKGVFEEQRYKEAADAFYTLVSLNAKEYGMWFGYGMAKKLEGENLEAALDAFSIANSLNPSMPGPYVHAADCYLKEGNLSEAERCLTHGKQLLTDEEKHADLKEWVEYLSKEVENVR